VHFVACVLCAFLQTHAISTSSTTIWRMQQHACSAVEAVVDACCISNLVQPLLLSAHAAARESWAPCCCISNIVAGCVPLAI
jgi:hypothetical protein